MYEAELYKYLNLSYDPNNISASAPWWFCFNSTCQDLLRCSVTTSLAKQLSWPSLSHLSYNLRWAACETVYLCPASFMQCLLVP